MSGFKDFSFDDDTELEQPHQTQPLYIELVPRTSWGDNLRTRMKKAEWDRLRKAQARWAGWRCEVCGESGKTQGFDWHVECHEVWDYDDRTQIQRLERLISLCPLCHKVKHYGRTFSVDGPEAARAAMDRLVPSVSQGQALRAYLQRGRPRGRTGRYGQTGPVERLVVVPSWGPHQGRLRPVGEPFPANVDSGLVLSGRGRSFHPPGLAPHSHG